MKIISIVESPKIEDSIDDIDTYPDYIKSFIDIMKDFDLSKFYLNIKDLEITPVEKNETSIYDAGAEYDFFANVIRYNRNKLKDKIMHELLHVATRVELDDRINVGFLQTLNSGYGIGIGLNEGYTSLMDDRYFKEYSNKTDEEINNIYPTEKYICRLLDLLIGEGKMEDYYMNADLYGLYNELASLSNIKETSDFIVNVDKLHDEMNRKPIHNYRNILITYPKIMYYLSKCFLYRFKEELHYGKINNDQYNKCVEFVKKLLDDRISCYHIIKSRRQSKYFDMMEKSVNTRIKSRVL